MTETDLNFMRKAVELAVGCNPKKDGIPKVGAVIAVGDVIIGTGQRGTGENGDDEHAEHNALDKVHDKTQLATATVYTTLEPCTREVRSKPLDCCTELLLQAKVKKVFIGSLDPNQGVRGKGFWELESHGIEVEFFPPSLRRELLAMNAKFVRFQQTIGATIVHPLAGQKYELEQQSNGTWLCRCTLVCKCVNQPDASIRIITQRGSDWWLAPNELSRVGESNEWKAELSFGGEGIHNIHVVKATDAGAVLLSYYQDVVNRNQARRLELSTKGVPESILLNLPGCYQGIKMACLPKGLESLAHVQVTCVRKQSF